MPFDDYDGSAFGDDTDYPVTNPENPPGSTTTQNAAGRWETTYRLGRPLTRAQIAQLQANVQGAGEGGNVTVSPDGRTLTIQAARTKSTLWKTLVIASAALVTAGVAATLAGGTGAATAASVGGETLGAGSGMLGATATVPTAGMMTAGAVPTGMGAAGAGAGAGAGLLSATQTVPNAGMTTAGAVPTGMGGAAAGGAGLAGLGRTAAGAMGGDDPWWKVAAKVGVPLAFGAANRGQGGQQTGPFDPAMQQKLDQLIEMAMGRQKRTEPIHQAAMAMATRLAPDYARNAMGQPQTPAAPSDTQSAIDQFMNSFGR